MLPRCWLVALFALLLCPLLARAQGIMVIPPDRSMVRPPSPPLRNVFAVKTVAIDATVRDQVADVQLTQVFRNTTSRDVEATFLFPVAADAVISQFTLYVDGRELPARMLSREEARNVYESIVRSQRDPALLEYVGHGALQTSVFPLPPNAERKITLRYSQVCRREQGITEMLLPLASARHSGRPVEELRITVNISNPGKIKSVYSPTFAVAVERPGDSSAIVRFTQKNAVLMEDFRLFWDLSDRAVGASLLSYRPDEKDDGYFLLLASPEVKATEASVSGKTVIFVLDRSGSMAGEKIKQAKDALKFVLNNLRDGDLFNLISYDHQVQSFQPELQNFTRETRAAAMQYIDSIHDGGSTNIDGALRRAMELAGNTGRPTYIIFLTDGLPTAGEMIPTRIAENVKVANRVRARLFVFGVGYDVNAQLLDQLALENFGAADYVRPNENIETAVAKFYGRMSAPVLTNVRLDLAAAQINRTYPRELPDLFAGGQILAIGRYRTPGAATVRLSGRSGSAEQAFEYSAVLATRSSDDTYAFVEKLWASRRIGEILVELDLKGRNKELIDELVRLSTKHGILTPYTSFLADERTALAPAANAPRAEAAAFDSDMAMTKNASGQVGVELRSARGVLQSQSQVQLNGASVWTDAKGQLRMEQNVQIVANQALYRRQNQWMDPSVTPEEIKNAERVEQFSDRYFELARNNARLRQFLAMPEGCTIRVDGRIYQVVNAANTPG